MIYWPSIALLWLNCSVSNKSKIIFKEYSPQQSLLLPPNLEDLIDENHPVKTVSEIIDRINLEGLIKNYKGGGSSAYHPRMLLKVLIYGYLCNIFSSRKLEAAIKENVHFMWLTGMSRPDHNTINRFRCHRLKEEIKIIFTQIVLLLEGEGHVTLQTTFVDGTKMEANANRYTFVWGKSIQKNKVRIEQQLEELWNYTQQVASEELKEADPVDFKAINKKKAATTLETIGSALENKKVPSKIRRKISYAKKNWPGKLEKYQEQEHIMGQRNSFSKTDPDATFMRMKEDHMKNGQLKPAYNLQISTHNQFILHYTIHHNPNDTKTLGPHLQSFKQQYGKVPTELVADAGYGSEQNYLLLQQENIIPYVKYNYFDKDRKAKNNPNPVTTSAANPQLALLRTQAYDLLSSERGINLRKQRCHDVETVFAQIKNNKGFRRFNLRGKSKVEVETGLLAIAHNLKKRAV